MFKKFVLVLTIVLSSASVYVVLKAHASETKTQPVQTTKKETLSHTDKVKKKQRKAGKSAPVSIALGKKLYKQYQCFDCHSLAGKGCENGMKLDSIGSKRTKEFIRDHIVDPEKHFDKHAKAFETDLNLMPPQNLEPHEVESLVEYLHSLK